jgi:hypothetical protein
MEGSSRANWWLRAINARIKRHGLGGHSPYGIVERKRLPRVRMKAPQRKVLLENDHRHGCLLVDCFARLLLGFLVHRLFLIRCFRFLLGLLENLVGRPMDLCDRIGRETCVSNCRSNVDVEAVDCQLRGGSGIGEALRLAFIDSAALVRGKRREELRVP